MTQRILITGGAGFIGSRLAKSLCEDNDVMVFDNFHPQVHGYTRVEEATGLVGKCRIVRGDVANAEELNSAVRAFNPDLIYHLAAETGTGQSYDEPTRYNLVNVVGTSNLIEAVRAHGSAVRRIVLSSSRAIYGEGAARDAQGRVRNAPPRRIEDMRRGDFDLKDEQGAILAPVPTSETLSATPASIYASTKLMQEYICTQCVAGTEVEVVILRLQNVYGPGQSLRNPYTGVISIFCQKVEQGEWLDVFEDGQIIRDFVYVDDVVDAFRRCGTLQASSSLPINIGSGTPVSILEMAKFVLSLYGRSPDDYRVTGNFRAGDVRHAVAEIALAREQLGWQPRTGFATGLKHFVEWAK
ncbi:NAD(P)-dependent oxidoreductase [Nitrosomonas sp. Nm33]|uniref:NAD-dependent epimerase/dehydratase family protein n=1 Tax=Nitrosomonas sp. Nm33 TaxID=133724 RepID=UPI001C40904D|nr:NAD-dependent epimerase/dehydratase family protein [Nitrosomonas sp. Nm33]